MSTLAIVLVAVAAVLLLLLAGGYAATRRRQRVRGGDYTAHLAAADRALEAARAEDRGWDRARLDAAARQALTAERPDFRPERLDLVLVDDRPGVSEDRAHLRAAGPDGEVTVVLCRQDGDWALERLE